MNSDFASGGLEEKGCVFSKKNHKWQWTTMFSVKLILLKFWFNYLIINENICGTKLSKSQLKRY